MAFGSVLLVPEPSGETIPADEIMTAFVIEGGGPQLITSMQSGGVDHSPVD